MKTICLKLACFNQWTVKIFAIPHLRQTYYKFLITKQGSITNRYESQHIYLTEAAARQSAYFFCLRATLDSEVIPAMIVDRISSNILSINLPAFELLAIDAVGLQMHHFLINQPYTFIHQHLQQSGRFNNTVMLQNADGDLIECAIKAEIDSYYSGWAIFYLRFNHHSGTCFSIS